MIRVSRRASRLLLALLVAPLLGAPAVQAQDETAPESSTDTRAYSQADLDRLLAPIALYPDTLLSQILMAATYPLEVVQAARWSRANPGLSGEQAIEAVEGEGWDPSVKALVAVPRVLEQMDEKLDWTRDLGDAYLAQPEQVAQTIQNLRRRAIAAGNLSSDARYRVVERDGDIIIEPAEPHVVYVPYYDPRVVYGPWWWAGYPPVYWAPWPGFHAHVGSGFYWSFGIFVGPRFFFSVWDWPHRHIKVVHVHQHIAHVDPKKFAHKVWRHDPKHRHGVKYRHAFVEKSFVKSHLRQHEARRDFRLHDQGKRKHRIVERGAAVSKSQHRASNPSQAGVGRLGMRHDRHVTSRHPNLPQPKVRQHTAPHPKLRNLGAAGASPGKWDGDRGRAHARTPRWRVDTPRTIAPKVRAASPPASRLHAPSPRHSAGFGSARGFNPPPRSAPVHPKVRNVAPVPKAALRAPSAPARSFTPKFSAGQRSFGKFQRH